jgi:peptidoglycan/LPS O-acetylase OafA/YrhL/CubicO group peptidase (beta-lactamase class C family)
LQAQPVEAHEERVQDTEPAHLPYLPGLDGVRALAVIAVLLYHAGLNLHGGYLGVESFFVLSGFLITALLMLDWQKFGRVRLKAFWMRRARRLLPALFVTLAGTLTLTAVLLPNELGALTQDTLAAIGYATNWYLVASQQSYFDAIERPSLLQHLWSLAIEEQFYIVWPLIFAAGMRFLRARGLLALTLLAMFASGALMAALYDPGADPSRIYYGTDTRASALLLGAALALVSAPGRTPAGQPPALAGFRRIGLALDLVGVLGLGGLLLAYAVLNDQHPLLYRGGLSLVAIATAIVIAAATHPQARLTPWLLERQPLRWIGLRSYGIYLWHWPIFMLTRPGVDIREDGWQLQLARFALAFAAAALSYTFVELPIRQGALGRVWQALRRPKGGPRLAAPALDDTPAPNPAAQPAAAPSQPAGLLSRIAWRPRMWYRRWAPLIATSVLAIGVTYVTASVSQAAMRNSLIDAGARAPTLPQANPPPRSAVAPEATAERSAATAAPTVAGAATPEPDSRPAAASAPQIDPALASDLQGILDAAVADGTIPGAVLSVHLPNGAIWTSASGLADSESEAAIKPETRVRIGSVSKMFTAVVALQLVEEGKLDLDAPIATWLPDLIPNADAITIRHLLQHTSGIFDYLEDRRFVSEAYAEPERVWEPHELVEYAIGFPPSFAPGAENRWDYSSTNYVILGMIIEQTTGRTLAQELRQRIFEPLDLHQTYALPEEVVEGPQAHGYSKSDDQTEISLSFGYAAANIVTTVGDLRLFGSALFTGDLLNPQTRKLMEQFVNAKGAYAMPDLEYGLGLMRNRLPIGDGADDQPLPPEASRVIGHIGGFGGFRAALWYAPESGTLVALGLNQASTDPNELATQVFEAILRQPGS